MKAFSETDCTEDLEKFDLPTLVIHGDAHQIVPIDASASLLKVYEGEPHGLCSTHEDQVNADLLSFIRA